MKVLTSMLLFCILRVSRDQEQDGPWDCGVNLNSNGMKRMYIIGIVFGMNIREDMCVLLLSGGVGD